jgi:capsular polysaccharide transport system permease protein
MELMRYGVFGAQVDAKWDVTVTIVATLFLLTVGLVLCRRVRRIMVVE